MGMAAGQARLLSITTRMSDNELRAQLINNDKMRLATKSAQVSEAYTTALNEAQMMFTNYDSDNKTSYKELTYNALTSYNPYNNQYAISNASGQVLVSEKDATNYKNADGDLNKFLASYGLQYTTDYFTSTIKTNLSEDGSLKYKAGVDENGESIYGSIQFNKNSAFGVNGESLAEVLQNMYTGIDGDDVHKGYDIIKSSQEYLNYSKDLSDYTKARETMMYLVSDKMQNVLQGMTTSNTPTTTFSELYEKIVTKTPTNTDLEDLSNLIGDKEEKTGLYKYATENGTKILEELQKYVKENNAEWFDSSYSSGSLSYAYDSTTSITTLTYKDITKNEAGEEEEGRTGLTFTKNGSSYTMKIDGSDVSIVGTKKEGDSSKIEFIYYVSDDGTISTEDKGGYSICKRTIDTSLFASSMYSGSQLKNSSDIGKIYANTKNTDENRKSVGTNVLDTIQNSITNIWDIAYSDKDTAAFTKFTDAPDGYYKTYIEAAQKFYKEVFGKELDKIPTSSTDILYNMDDIEKLKEAINTNATEDKQKSFQSIYDAYILDCVMDTYGEPKFTWIDKNNKNANGETKAQWYTNLFNRMKSGGYKTLQDGLASSAEWIKFAFESGLVTLEQVDGSNTWNSTTYSNCSDITEQTNNTAVTIAEAEYTAQMNKIQNKDKMYDLELKNIDTEHNSLQTEYESIKSAVDKNIERTFKIYS